MLKVKHQKIEINADWKESKYGFFFWSECGSIQTRKYSVFGQFSRSAIYGNIKLIYFNLIVKLH